MLQPRPFGPASVVGSRRVPSLHQLYAHRRIELIASDVDGTLLNSQQQLTVRVESAVNSAAEAGVQLIFATGKARGPWLQQVSQRIPWTLPAVLLQGLYVCECEGAVLRNWCLDEAVMLECIRLAKEFGVTLTGYSGTRIVCEATDEQTDRLLFYREPTPEGVGDMRAFSTVTNKLIFMAPQPRIVELRPVVERAMAGRASLTTAIPGMLEVLPLGASKGEGLLWLLSRLGVDPAGVMALGDGENDLEMLRSVGLGVAMGNAGAKVKAAASVVTASNDQDGVADAIELYVLKPRAAAGPTDPLVATAAPARSLD